MAKILCDFKVILTGRDRFRICDKPAKFAVRTGSHNSYRCSWHARGYKQRQDLTQELREE